MQVRREGVAEHLLQGKADSRTSPELKATPGEARRLEALQASPRSWMASPARRRTHCHDPAHGCCREPCRFRGYGKAKWTLNSGERHASHSRTRGTAHAVRSRPLEACLTISLLKTTTRKISSASLRDKSSIVVDAQTSNVTGCPFPRPATSPYLNNRHGFRTIFFRLTAKSSLIRANRRSFISSLSL